MNVLYQISTLNALIFGDLYGVISVKELLEIGNFGIGISEGVDGELILLDGIAYNEQANGIVRKYNYDEKIAFATVGKFSENMNKYVVQSVRNIEELSKKMTKIIDEKYKNKNVFYMIRIKTFAEYVKIRSYFKEEEPYRTIMELNQSQVKFEYMNIKGDIIGIFSPDYVDKLSIPGWHFHFISEDKTKGGHLLDIAFNDGQVSIDQKNKYEIILSTSAKFPTIKLNADL